MCVGLSDREDWLEVSDREVKAIPPGVKPVLVADKAPAPVVGPDVGPAVGPDSVVEPKQPNILILAKPPTKVSVFVCVFIPVSVFKFAKCLRIDDLNNMCGSCTDIYQSFTMSCSCCPLVSSSSSLYIHRKRHFS